jgi:hypothetical protein
MGRREFLAILLGSFALACRKLFIPNDSPRLQALLNGKDAVKFPSGTYNLFDMIEIPPGVHFLDGSNSVLKWQGQSQGVMLLIQTGRPNLVIQNLIFDYCGQRSRALQIGTWTS